MTVVDFGMYCSQPLNFLVHCLYEQVSIASILVVLEPVLRVRLKLLILILKTNHQANSLTYCNSSIISTGKHHSVQKLSQSVNLTNVQLCRGTTNYRRAFSDCKFGYIYVKIVLIRIV